MAKTRIQKGKLNVSDYPVLPCIRGDGTGPDIDADALNSQVGGIAIAPRRQHQHHRRPRQLRGHLRHCPLGCQ